MGEEITPYKGELIKRGGRWLSPRPGNYVHRFTQELLVKVNKVTPREIAEMQFGKAFQKASAATKLLYERWVRCVGWIDYQALQDNGILCYPAYDLSHHSKIIYYKTYRGDRDDAKYWPIYRDRLRRNMERAERRYRTALNVHRKAA